MFQAVPSRLSVLASSLSHLHGCGVSTVLAASSCYYRQKSSPCRVASEPLTLGGTFEPRAQYCEKQTDECQPASRFPSVQSCRKPDNADQLGLRKFKYNLSQHLRGTVPIFRGLLPVGTAQKRRQLLDGRIGAVGRGSRLVTPDSDKVPASNGSKPSASTRSITSRFDRASSPATGSAIRLFAPFGRPLRCRLFAVMLLNVLITGRPRMREVHSDSTSPASIS